MKMRFALHILLSTLVLSLASATIAYPAARAHMRPESLSTEPSPAGPERLPEQVFLPMLITPEYETPRVNAPYFGEQVKLAESAIFWFGEVNSAENYTDVRVGYTDQELYVRLQTFDRLLWYDTQPSQSDLERWDAGSLSLDLGGGKRYRFMGQLVWWEERDHSQAAYQWDGSNWSPASISFKTKTGWRGQQPNDMQDDRGWWINFNIPFESLGLSGPPDPGTIWHMALKLHDRDSAAGPARPDHLWPELSNEHKPSTWGELSFGLAQYHPAADASPAGTTTIRHKLNGANVVDGMVGGGTRCGSQTDFWTEWGYETYPGAEQVNVQNQSDVADWPCFSKFFITFPLQQVPPGKTILSAKLTLYQFGNAGDGSPGGSPTSLIQVLRTENEGWNEADLNWNNAPSAIENVARAWVPPIDVFPGWPGVPITWDVSKAVADAYAQGQPLRLVLYSADADYHSGRYFISSDSPDWNAEGRPSLEIAWGEP
jgi:hypothetical protein